MKHPFKLEDRVYHFRFGWCTVIDAVSKIQLKDSNSDRCAADADELSFVEYNLVTGGLSHVRPIVPPKPGDIVYYQDRSSVIPTWNVGRCKSYDADTRVLYLNMNTVEDLYILEIDTVKTKWSTTNPFTDELS